MQKSYIKKDDKSWKVIATNFRDTSFTWQGYNKQGHNGTQQADQGRCKPATF